MARHAEHPKHAAPREDDLFETHGPGGVDSDSMTRREWRAQQAQEESQAVDYREPLVAAPTAEDGPAYRDAFEAAESGLNERAASEILFAKEVATSVESVEQEVADVRQQVAEVKSDYELRIAEQKSEYEAKLQALADYHAAELAKLWAKIEGTTPAPVEQPSAAAALPQTEAEPTAAVAEESVRARLGKEFGEINNLDEATAKRIYEVSSGYDLSDPEKLAEYKEELRAAGVDLSTTSVSDELLVGYVESARQADTDGTLLDAPEVHVGRHDAESAARHAPSFPEATSQPAAELDPALAKAAGFSDEEIERINAERRTVAAHAPTELAGATPPVTGETPEPAPGAGDGEPEPAAAAGEGEAAEPAAGTTPEQDADTGLNPVDRLKKEREALVEDLQRAEADENEDPEKIAELKAEIEKLDMEIVAVEAARDSSTGVAEGAAGSPETGSEQQTPLGDLPTKPGSEVTMGTPESKRNRFVIKMKNWYQRAFGNRIQEEQAVEAAARRWAYYEELGEGNVDEGRKLSTAADMAVSLTKEGAPLANYEVTPEGLKDAEGKAIDLAGTRAALIAQGMGTKEYIGQLSDEQLVDKLMQAKEMSERTKAAIEGRKEEELRGFDFDRLTPDQRRSMAQDIYGSRMADWDDKTIQDALQGNNKLQNFIAGGVRYSANKLGTDLWVTKVGLGLLRDELRSKPEESPEERKKRIRRSIGVVALGAGGALGTIWGAVSLARMTQGAGDAAAEMSGGMNIHGLGQGPYEGAADTPYYGLGQSPYDAGAGESIATDGDARGMDVRGDYGTEAGIDGLNLNENEVEGITITAEHIDNPAPYQEYQHADKITTTSMQGQLDMTSAETAYNDIEDNALQMTEQASMMVKAMLSEEDDAQLAQLERLGLVGLDDNQRAEALRDPELRAETLNVLRDCGSELSITEGATGKFYNYGAEAIAWDENGNVTDVRIVQSEIHLNNVDLLKIVNAGGEVSYFNSQCGNFLTEQPVPDIPVVPYVPTEGTGTEGTGEEGTGTEGTGEEGTGTEGTGEEGTGVEGTGEEGTGTEGTGEEGTGTEGTGEEGTGTEGTGEEGTGTEGTGEEGTGTEGTGEEGGEVQVKNPEEDINANLNLPEQIQMGDSRADAGELKDATPPPAEYTKPQPQPDPGPAPEAQPVTPEVREEEVVQAPVADGANGSVGEDRQRELEESGAGGLETDENGTPIGNDGRVDG